MSLGDDRQFQVKTEIGSLRVRITRNLSELRRTGGKYKRAGMAFFEANPNGRYGGALGTITLSESHLTTEYIFHECIHAALWAYRLYHGTEDVHIATDDQEEFVAYGASELAAAVYRACHRKILSNRL